MTSRLLALPILTKVSKPLIASISLFAAYYNDELTSEGAIFTTTDDDVYTVGSNQHYQLGTGDTINRTQPYRLESVSNKNVVHVAMTVYNGMVLTRDGTIFLWGNNRYGHCGNGNVGDIQKVPFRVTGIVGKSIDVKLSSSHVLALTELGKVYAWGRNIEGALGVDYKGNIPTPTLVDKLSHTRVIQIAAGITHSAALTDSGVYCWGGNEQFQLGDGTSTSRHYPAVVTALNNKCITKISCGTHHTLALDDQGTIFAWGNNIHGQIGSGTTKNQCVPFRISGLLATEWVNDIEASICGSLCTTVSGNLYYWGFFSNNCRSCTPTIAKYSSFNDFTLDVCKRTCRLIENREKPQTIHLSLFGVLKREGLVDVLIYHKHIRKREQEIDSQSKRKKK